MNTVKNCCIGNSMVVIQPELGYIVNKQTTVSLALRLGFPVGANIDALMRFTSSFSHANVTFLRLFLRAYSNAKREMRVEAFSVMIFRLSTTPGTTSCSNPE